MKIPKAVLSAENLQKLEALNNPFMMDVVDRYITLLKPSKVTVITDDPKDIEYVRKMAAETGEEKPLATEGHTIHYDGYQDQARDKANTRVLVTPEMKMSKVINQMDREKGLEEIHGIMEGIMEGKEALVRFFCLGPLDSRFSISALQITDSFYVGHSEDILYRSGYNQFRKLGGSQDFFYFIHSAGALDDRGNSRDIDRRRIYIDLKEQRVFTMNNQYAGNSVGLKKLALRLGIYKANNENWLAEHMFIMGLKPPSKDRISYFTGAFPSACGKTSTAMVPGMTIVGDDLAYIRKGEGGKAFAVNIEQGIFGIITDVNPSDDPLIFKSLTTPRELIFSNILVNDGKSYWLNMGKELPKEGTNHSGEWKMGDKDSDQNTIDYCHKNSRYTIRITELENVDPNLDEPEGVSIDGVIYGGRDSDTSVPVFQSFDWVHGVVIGATLESETTSATLGQEGVRVFQPMSNLDFLVVPLGKYVYNHLRFGSSLSRVPKVFSTNYFLKDEGKFLNEKVDKKVWLIWMEGRVHGDYGAIETPIGYIPIYEDLKSLFKQVFDREYTREDYEKQFTVRFAKFLEKIDRIERIYREESDIPQEFTDCLGDLRKRLVAAREKHGSDEAAPSDLEK